MAEQYEAPAAQWNGNITLNLGGFRTLIFTHAEELVDAQVAEQSKTINPKDGSITFLPADSPGLQVYKTLDERYENVEKSLQKLIANEETEKFANTIKEVLQITKDESKDGTELYEAYQIVSTWTKIFLCDLTNIDYLFSYSHLVPQLLLVHVVIINFNLLSILPKIALLFNLPTQVPLPQSQLLKKTRILLIS